MSIPPVTGGGTDLSTYNGINVELSSIPTNTDAGNALSLVNSEEATTYANIQLAITQDEQTAYNNDYTTYDISTVEKDANGGTVTTNDTTNLNLFSAAVGQLQNETQADSKPWEANQTACSNIPTTISTGQNTVMTAAASVAGFWSSLSNNRVT